MVLEIEPFYEAIHVIEAAAPVVDTDTYQVVWPVFSNDPMRLVAWLAPHGGGLRQLEPRKPPYADRRPDLKYKVTLFLPVEVAEDIIETWRTFVPHAHLYQSQFLDNPSVASLESSKQLGPLFRRKQLDLTLTPLYMTKWLCRCSQPFVRLLRRIRYRALIYLHSRNL